MNVIVAVTVVVGLIGLIPCASASAIHIEYFHAPGCPPCKQTDSIIVGFEKTYDDVLIAERIDINTPDGWDRWLQYGFTNVPAVVINGAIKIPKEEITEDVNGGVKVYRFGRNKSVHLSP